MDTSTILQSPFAALSFVKAPAMLTNASSVLALSTINRMLRTRDSMRELLKKAESIELKDGESARLIEQINRVEKQGALLLRALYSIYISLAAFAGATLVALLGAGFAPVAGKSLPLIFAVLGLALGFAAAGGLVYGCVNLLHATLLSLANIRDEALAAREGLTEQMPTKRRVRKRTPKE